MKQRSKTLSDKELIEKQEKMLDSTRVRIQEHIDLTRRRSEANERYLKLESENTEIIHKNKINEFDTVIDLLKSVFTVSVTSFFALRVINAEWVNSNSQLESTILFIIFLSVLSVVLLLYKRSRHMEKIASISKMRADVLKALLDAELSCLKEMQEIHSSLWKLQSQNTEKELEDLDRLH